MRGVRLAIEEVDDIEEAFQSTVLEVLTDGNEDGRDTGGDTDGVLNVEVGLNAGIATRLGVGATVEGLEGEGGARGNIGTVLLQEGLDAHATLSMGYNSLFCECIP